MLRRISYVLFSLTVGWSLLAITVMVAGEQQPVTPRPLSLTASELQRFAPASAAETDITLDDVIAAARKWEAVRPALDSYWGTLFASAGRQFSTQRGPRYVAPRVEYCGRGTTDALCREASSGPFYSPRNHSNYFSPFVAQEMKNVGERLGTDGDMAAVNILAHEWGHAMQQVLGISHSATKPHELQADCFAGAFANHAYQQGYIEEGDIEEAQMGMAQVGDARNSHGTPKERLDAFSKGYESGVGVCRY